MQEDQLRLACTPIGSQDLVIECDCGFVKPFMAKCGRPQGWHGCPDTLPGMKAVKPIDSEECRMVTNEEMLAHINVLCWRELDMSFRTACQQIDDYGRNWLYAGSDIEKEILNCWRVLRYDPWH